MMVAYGLSPIILFGRSNLFRLFAQHDHKLSSFIFNRVSDMVNRTKKARALLRPSKFEVSAIKLILHVGVALRQPTVTRSLSLLAKRLKVCFQ